MDSDWVLPNSRVKSLALFERNNTNVPEINYISANKIFMTVLERRM
jgi:uncharacterized protein YkuJ